ncbi:MAG: hypothetical protein FGM27_08505 [Candidatus Omnitrophica bacterium]|nr:hypothetical protein [Candidatus Omnitrophota bacterium]
MIFHYGTEIPTRPVTPPLDEQSPRLTEKETEILRAQIRRNSRMAHDYLLRLDLLLNKEKYPQNAVFIKKLRRKLELLMDENDTFRKVLWSDLQKGRS